jgi:hypothetical protein
VSRESPRRPIVIIYADFEVDIVILWTGVFSRHYAVTENAQKLSMVDKKIMEI